MVKKEGILVDSNHSDTWEDLFSRNLDEVVIKNNYRTKESFARHIKELYFPENSLEPFDLSVFIPGESFPDDIMADEMAYAGTVSDFSICLMVEDPSYLRVVVKFLKNYCCLQGARLVTRLSGTSLVFSLAREGQNSFKAKASNICSKIEKYYNMDETQKRVNNCPSGRFESCFKLFSPTEDMEGYSPLDCIAVDLVFLKIKG